MQQKAIKNSFSHARRYRGTRLIMSALKSSIVIYSNVIVLSCVVLIFVKFSFYESFQFWGKTQIFNLEYLFCFNCKNYKFFKWNDCTSSFKYIFFDNIVIHIFDTYFSIILWTIKHVYFREAENKLIKLLWSKFEYSLQVF